MKIYPACIEIAGLKRRVFDIPNFLHLVQMVTVFFKLLPFGYATDN